MKIYAIQPSAAIEPKQSKRKPIPKINSQISADVALQNAKSSSNLPLEVVRQQVVAQRIALLKPIKSEKVYERLFTNIIKYLLYKLNSNENCRVEFDSVADMFGSHKIHVEDLEYINLDGYEDVDFNLKGLVPYCGYSDMSRQINCWLTARTDDNPSILTDNQMADIIRAFEYSLNQLDKKYGKIESTVYRSGYFNPITDKQYYSASDYISCAIEHSYRKEPSENMQYSIIHVKNGHDIYDFQKDTATEISSGYAMVEREVLIDRKSVFRRVPKEKYTKKDWDDIRSIVYQTIDCDMEDLSPDRKQRILDNIFVWEEI